MRLLLYFLPFLQYAGAIFVQTNRGNGKVLLEEGIDIESDPHLEFRQKQGSDLEEGEGIGWPVRDNLEGKCFKLLKTQGGGGLGNYLARLENALAVASACGKTCIDNTATTDKAFLPEWRLLYRVFDLPKSKFLGRLRGQRYPLSVSQFNISTAAEDPATCDKLVEILDERGRGQDKTGGTNYCVDLKACQLAGRNTITHMLKDEAKVAFDEAGKFEGLMIHLRGGDAFVKNRYSQAKMPVPCAFYKDVIREGNYKEVLVINEDAEHPCISVIQEQEKARGIKVTVQQARGKPREQANANAWMSHNKSIDTIRDAATMMNAKDIVLSLASSFSTNLILLSPRLNKVYYPVYANAEEGSKDYELLGGYSHFNQEFHDQICSIAPGGSVGYEMPLPPVKKWHRETDHPAYHQKVAWKMPKPNEYPEIEGKYRKFLEDYISDDENFVGTTKHDCPKQTNAQ